MSWDLIHGNLLQGKTAPEVEELIGKPMHTDTFGDTPTMPFFDTL
jgi:hypothetical protein